ncbi:hypothetical protein PFICI_15335 [Pestalotiopsis fici W106-1]|uniref:Glycosyl hydrolase family 92 N-terminal domain-containing protein n=1 Tax=Pestalotiopsis fici (strain W106-1 / CGMCC3.15140) TaxID=1229662 RepID=W3WGA6_PESFW|nr:uncharacterized protein PFICI_15335 [Pestalotiopsis fici W106-1]ETS72943.1 hypothetical protein PFICI_15335 [Pestalotiopsis fici W106-1]
MRIISILSWAGAATSYAVRNAVRIKSQRVQLPDYHKNAGVLRYVNPLIGTNGANPDNNGGMIPSVSIPFGMTRWTPQTRGNFISQVPCHDTDQYIHGFQATHQPAIWMGEQGQVVLTPGWSQEIKALFQERGLAFRKEDEVSTPYVYEVLLNADTQGEHGWNLTEEAAGGGPVPGGAGSAPLAVIVGANGRIRRSKREPNARDRTIRAAMGATAHVGFLRFDFEDAFGSEGLSTEPYIHVQASHMGWNGDIRIDPGRSEISGSNTERQDYKLGPNRSVSFKGFFISRFSIPFSSFGTTNGGNVTGNSAHISGGFSGGYVKFPANTTRVEVRTAVSFVSVEQARKNLEFEVPDDMSFEDMIESTKHTWLDKLGRVTIEGVNSTDKEHDPRTIWYTGLYHALQYPNDFSEPLSDETGSAKVYYNGYADSVHKSNE